MHKKLRFFKGRSSAGKANRAKQRGPFHRHPLMVPLATFLLLLTAAVGGVLLLGGTDKVVATDSLITTISHDHEEQTVPVHENITVGALLAKLKIPVNSGDVVEPSVDTAINQDEFRVNVYRAVPVEIVDSHHKTFTFSAATTSRSIVKQAGVAVYPEDYLSILPTTNFLKDGAIGKRVVIGRATPVHLNLYGKQLDIRTHAKTVGELLSEKGIKLHRGDTLKPAAKTPIARNQQIFITHKGTKIVSVSQDVAMPTQVVRDPNLSLGTQAVRQQGAPGKKVVTYMLELRNGKVVGRKIIQSVVVVPPITQIVAQGSAELSMSLQQWLGALRQCESGGNYQSNTGNGYYGAYQFSPSTWQSLGYGGLPSAAAPYTQDQAVIRNTLRSGLASQNPGCYHSTGISNYPPR